MNWSTIIEKRWFCKIALIIICFQLDLVVTNGLRLYYDKPRKYAFDKPRKYDAAMLSVGSSVVNLIIPPNREKWMITGSCPKACSSVSTNYVFVCDFGRSFL